MHTCTHAHMHTIREGVRMVYEVAESNGGSICTHKHTHTHTHTHTQHTHTARGVRIVYEVADYHGGSIYGLAWHSNGTLLATGSNDKTILLVSLPKP